jgi:hypothetical protein
MIQLIGVNRSPFTRRVAVTLRIYGIAFEQRPISGFGNRAEVRAPNPLGVDLTRLARVPRTPASARLSHWTPG